MTRIYTNQTIKKHAVIRLDSEASGHLLRVLRMKKDDVLNVFDGKGHEYSAKITEIQKKHAVISIEQPIDSLTESPLWIHLGQSISRGEKMDYSLQKSVELGVQKITPLFTTRGGVKLTKDRLEKKVLHWQKVIISACEQCGRSYLPQLMAPQSLDDWLKNCEEEMRFVLAPSGEHQLRDIKFEDERVALLIGPEGGLDESEIDLAKTFSFAPLRLGPRILRTETAAPTAVAALQCLWGDLG